MRQRYSATQGFTLPEMVAVIAITGIIAAVVAVFMRAPLQAYVDAQRRTAVTDAADTVFSLLKRDLQTALPNSLRVTNIGGTFLLEFLHTRTGGRYRLEEPDPAAPTGVNTCPDGDADGSANENVFEFGVSDSCFTTLGTVASLSTIAPNSDYLVVYNLGAGFTEADAYASGVATGGNKSLIVSASAGAGGENVIRFQPNTFTLESPGRRFHVVSGPVSYICDPAAGTLTRITGYPIAAAQPTAPAGASSLLATGVSGCTITYDQNVINQRVGIVSMWLRLSDAGGTNANLFQQVQVSNEP